MTLHSTRPSRHAATDVSVEWVAAGMRVVADIHLVTTEIERRRAFGSLGAGLDHLDTLRFLLTLPIGEAVPARGLTPYEARLASRAVAARFGRMERSHTRAAAFVRLAHPPVHVDLITVHGPATERTLRETTRFAPYAARRMHTPRPVGSALMIEARYYGVGVTVADIGGGHDILDPAPFTPARYTAASWQFAERAYSRLAGVDQPR